MSCFIFIRASKTGTFCWKHLPKISRPFRKRREKKKIKIKSIYQMITKTHTVGL